jgi:hypothetical protein
MTGGTWARVGFATGIAASISANVAHSLLDIPVAAGAVVSAAFWPMALLIAIEVITRVTWPPGLSWRVLRYGGLTTVAGIAAIISYRHMAALLVAYHEDALSAAIGPLAVDGLMAVCSGALLAIAYNERQAAAERGNETPPTGLVVAATRVYLESVEAGKPLTGKQLGEQFGRSQRWGRNIVGEAKNQP